MVYAAIHKVSSHPFMTGNGRRYKSGREVDCTNAHELREWSLITGSWKKGLRSRARIQSYLKVPNRARRHSISSGNY